MYEQGHTEGMRGELVMSMGHLTEGTLCGGLVMRTTYTEEGLALVNGGAVEMRELLVHVK